MTRPRRIFTPAEATATLPYVRRVIADIVSAHCQICEVYSKIDRFADEREAPLFDDGDVQQILNQSNGVALSSEDKAYLLEEYGRPLDIPTLVRDVDTPEHAAEVYAASLLMVCLLYTSPSPRDGLLSRMPSSA